MPDWFTINLEQLTAIAFTAALVYILLIVFVRLNGLRSFSKMSCHDFAVTIAIGSILATVCLQKEPSLLQGVFAIGFFLGLQSLFSYWRIKNPGSYSWMENEPLLLMDGSEILHENLKRAKITESDLMAKLREANAYNFDRIRAVVFETTGDISVLHGEDDLDKKLLKDVRR